MSKTIQLPFYAFTLYLHNGEKVTVPLLDANALHLKKPVETLAEKYAETLQDKLLNKGDYLNLMDEFQNGPFSKGTVSVPFSAARDGLSFPAFELSFDYFYQERENSCWGIIPALGLETMSQTAEMLPERLREVVRVDFTANKRLSAVQHIVSTLWFDQVEINKAEVEITVYAPSELEDLRRQTKKDLLPKVASRLKVKVPVTYGRKEELKHLQRILGSSYSKNVLITGPSGSGKTALVRELAYRMEKAQTGQYIWETTASAMIKELTLDTGWQDNLSNLVQELADKGDFLFVRNLADLFEVGQYQGNEISMAEYLRPHLGRGEIALITECTPEERARIELRSPNYLSFFQVLELSEPVEDLEDIIRKKVQFLAGRRKVRFEEGAIEEIIRLHRRFSPYSGMPGKPIRFLESILTGKGGHQKTHSSGPQKTKDTSAVTMITRSSVLNHFCSESGLPAFMVDPEQPMDLQSIKSTFNRNVFGQELATETVVDMLASVKAALTRTGKPIASFLFAGPTGVGKTELAKVLTTFMFGDPGRMLRFDMSEFSDPWSLMRLTGQGAGADGLLTSAVRRDPFCVLLFDEIEKADVSFYDLLLQILGEGRLSDSRGKLVNFCSAIIIMTSNIGASTLQRHRIGWQKGLEEGEVTGHFIREVEKRFKPELFNRLDAVVSFRPLSQETMRYVVEREIELFRQREGVRFRRLDLNIRDEVLDYLAVKGYDARYGARYLQRTIRRELIIPLAYELNRFEYDERLIIEVRLENGEVTIDTAADPLAFDLLMEQWDVLTLSEKTSALRRKMMKVREGPLFMRLQSETDLMEAEKKQDGKKFWSNRARSGQYTLLLGAAEKAGDLSNVIQDLEIEIALAGMEQGPYASDFDHRLAEWEHQFFDWQLSLYSLLLAKSDQCFIGIYGRTPVRILRFYLDILSLKNIPVASAKAIWYREGYSPSAGGENAGKPYPVTSLTEEQVRALQIKPSKPGDQLFGLELELPESWAYLYLKDESGIQLWENANSEAPEPFFVMVNDYEISTPTSIHRKSFYTEGKPGRLVTRERFIDYKLEIDMPYRQEEVIEAVGQALERKHRRLIDHIFLAAQ